MGDGFVGEQHSGPHDRQPVMAVGIMEFRDGKVVRERIYFGDPWEPPAWRTHWVERFDPREQDSSVSAHQPREHRSAVRLSHGAKIGKWREHKAPKTCRLDQLK